MDKISKLLEELIQYSEMIENDIARIEKNKIIEINTIDLLNNLYNDISEIINNYTK